MPPPSTSAHSVPPATPTTDKLRRKDVNSTFLHILLKDPSHARQNIGTTTWIENDVFPPSIYQNRPFGLFTVQNTPTLYNGTKMTYAREPHGMTDSLIRTWFNNIATNHGASHHRTNKDIICCFDARTATKGPAGCYTLLKPDLSVISGTPHDSNQAHATERLHWREIYAFVEITGQKTGAEAHVTAQIAEKAACIFDVQHQRQFIWLWASLASLITSNLFLR